MSPSLLPPPSSSSLLQLLHGFVLGVHRWQNVWKYCSLCSDLKNNKKTYIPGNPQIVHLPYLWLAEKPRMWKISSLVFSKVLTLPGTKRQPLSMWILKQQQTRSALKPSHPSLCEHQSFCPVGMIQDGGWSLCRPGNRGCEETVLPVGHLLECYRTVISQGWRHEESLIWITAIHSSPDRRPPRCGQSRTEQGF